MSVSAYSKTRVLLHWLSAMVIVWVLVSGFYISAVDVTADIKQTIAFFNVSLTTVFIPFFVWRVGLAVAYMQPSRVRSLSFMQTLAPLAHVSIYLTVSVVLVSGVLMMDRPISVFALFELPQPLSDPALIARFLALHVQSCVFLSLLLMVHVAAVIFHEWRGHRVLRRMGLRACTNGRPT